MQIGTMSGNQLLTNGLETVTNPDKFRETMNKVSEAAFAAVFQAQDEGKLKWERAGDNLTDLVTEVTVKDNRGEDVTMPVIFFTKATDDGFVDGYLMLGSKHNAPCRNTADPRVKRLYTQVTEKPWSHTA
jgi:hypothetical protein